MTIQQLLELKLYEEASGGFMLTVKHTHKITKVQGGWTQELTLTDDTGDILADMVMETYCPFVRRQEIRIMLCEIQPSPKDKKLFVTKWEKITCTADELPQRDPLQQIGPDWEAIGRGKVKHGQVCAAMRLGEILLRPQTLGDYRHNEKVRQEIIKWTDWVMSEKDIYNG